MDFLFAELMLSGKAENYQWFALGMVPLAGLELRPLAPLWHKMGAAIFDMGDPFYNFADLYEYKAKVSPHWQPPYLATPGGGDALCPNGHHPPNCRKLAKDFWQMSVKCPV